MSGKRKKLGEAAADVEERILSSWSLSAVLFSQEVSVKNPHIRRVTWVKLTSRPSRTKEKKSFIIFRTEILRLLAQPKPSRDQLVFELPCLMGFRTQEIATWRAEYINFASSDCEVLDAKKHRLFTIPLNLAAGKHAEETLNGEVEGYVIKNQSNAWQGRNKPLSSRGLLGIWQKYAAQLDLWPSPNEYSPIVGRRFFAAEWFYTQKLSPATLSKIMRHTHIETTLRYVSRILFYEDIKRDYDKFQFKVMQDMTENKEMIKV